MTQQLKALQEAMPNPSCLPTPTTQTVTSSKGLKIAVPDNFDGTMSKADTFLSQLALYFIGKKMTDDMEKVMFTLSYIKGGTAGPWAKLKVQEYMLKGESQNWKEFSEDFISTFGDPDKAGTARFKMELLKQGASTADEYITSFKELQVDSEYNDAALIEKFEKGLNTALVDKIYGLPSMPKNLKEWMEWASKLDRQWRRREIKKKAFAVPTSVKQPLPLSKPSKPTYNPPNLPRLPVSTSLPSNPIPQASKGPDVAPMEVDSGWKKVKSPICFKCRKPGHIAKFCTSSVDINSMDFDSLKAYFTEGLQNTKEEDF